MRLKSDTDPWGQIYEVKLQRFSQIMCDLILLPCTQHMSHDVSHDWAREDSHLFKLLFHLASNSGCSFSVSLQGCAVVLPPYF